MNKEIRKKTILAMELLVRSINNENQIEPWLMNGVPDGEIQRYEIEEVEEDLIENNEYAYLMNLFLKIMANAYEKGGLCSDGVLNKGE